MSKAHRDHDRPPQHLSVDPARKETPPDVSESPPAKRRELSLDDYLTGVRTGDRAVLGRAITLIESANPDQRKLAGELLTRLMPDTGRAIRVGVTGVPGVGKSTFIDAFGALLTTQHNRRVAVLAVDPSSGVSGGSILGDKTRMTRLVADDRAFIRPSPSAGTLGGVAAKTRETLLLCEAAGYDVVLVETVGVGQSETVVAEMTDFFLALMLPGAGDELQGIKRGLLELVDLVAVNKSDGDNIERAKRAEHDIGMALHYLPPRDDSYMPSVLRCSARTDAGLGEIWRIIAERCAHLADSGGLERRRRGQMLRWMWSLVEDELRRAVRANSAVRAALPELERAVEAGEIPPTRAAREILAAFGVA